jgi:hypothetical protein
MDAVDIIVFLIGGLAGAVCATIYWVRWIRDDVEDGDTSTR